MSIAEVSSRNDADPKTKVWTQAEAAEVATVLYFQKEREIQGLGKTKIIRLSNKKRRSSCASKKSTERKINKKEKNVRERAVYFMRRHAVSSSKRTVKVVLTKKFCASFGRAIRIYQRKHMTCTTN